ncbi:hypothetical protein CYMTET_21473 [Cymbomonas tetramitiformis]|uniref:Uncharacterized protein n=1 Tax=Cymbomonas tetramitiformis TaxID=36881 RepID=A0AAE0G2F6_9CHLO|nr:hypothetical protein CYMTET_21473 [Cymbomonas tetramitiformis]
MLGVSRYCVRHLSLQEQFLTQNALPKLCCQQRLPREVILQGFDWLAPSARLRVAGAMCTNVEKATHDLIKEEDTSSTPAVSAEKPSTSTDVIKDAQGFPYEVAVRSGSFSECEAESDKSILQVQQALISQLLNQCALFLLPAYAVLTSLVFFYLRDHCEYLNQSERTAALTSAFIFGVAVLESVLKTSLDIKPYQAVEKVVRIVATVAGLTNLMLATIQVPVMRDPVTGCRVQMLRWVEWTVCAFAMTFVVQVVNAKSMKDALPLALSEGLSALCGLLLPLASSTFQWFVLMTISFILYYPIFPSAYSKWKAYLAVRDTPQHTWADVSLVSQMRTAHRLLLTCAIAWTLLVINYFVEPIVLRFWGEAEGRIYGYFSQLILDVMLKKFYFWLVASFQESLFDPLKEVESDLRLSQQQMQMVWDNCGDGLVLFFKDRAGGMQMRISPSLREMLPKENLERELQQSYLNKLVKLAWAEKDSKSLKVDEICTKNGRKIYTESKVDISLGETRTVVVRDISDRVQRFEAEKALAVSVVARQKDDEANHFCRHEVKNGLLAAQFQLLSIIDMHAMAMKSNNVFVSSEYPEDISTRLNSCVSEIKHTMNTVLLATTAKDIVNDTYMCHEENVSLSKLFSYWCETNHRLFISPKGLVNALPEVSLDTNVLTIIKNNAVSNALKYGHRSTPIFIDAQIQEGSLTFIVENSPGAHQDELLSLDDTDLIFSKGWQLHAHGDPKLQAESSGDGGWIMQRCSKALGGTCDIQFLPESTLLTLSFPVQINMTSSFCTSYQFPSDLWVLFIDDSPSQRLMFAQIFRVLGMPTERMFIKGKDEEEIMQFHDFAMDFIRSKPGHKFILVFDENLEFMCMDSGKTEVVSGSSIAKQMRTNLGEQEQSTLMLVRSANDGAKDIELFLARAHGTLSKRMMKKEEFLNTLVPMIVERFGISDASEDAGGLEEMELAQSIAEEIRGDIQLLKGICKCDGECANVSCDWNLAKRLLHRIKGNLYMVQSERASPILQQKLQDVKEIEGTAFPEVLRDIIVHLQATFDPPKSES